MSEEKRRKGLSHTKVMILGYVGLIAVGTALLCMPFSSADGRFTPVLDALFTSTSAACVTGLVVVDTAAHWSIFGKCVILLLIQVGGLGFITLAIAAVMLTGKKIGLKSRLLMQESISAPQTGGILRLTSLVLAVTGIVELVGAAALAVKFIPRFGVLKGIGYSLFHSISAFCNAGFDVLGKEFGQFSSFTSFWDSKLVNITLMALIVFGGLGFFVWQDLMEHKLRVRKYSLQTKIVLTSSAVLILVPAVFMFFVEGDNLAFTGGTLEGRILASLFQSVTARTAGFNTVDLGSLSQPSLLMTIILMLIGAAPGSTGGGMKTTTVIVLLLCVGTTLRRRESVEAFSRRIDEPTVYRAVTIAGLYGIFFILSTLALCLFDGISAMSSAFECASAIGTVGLTLGVTPSLSAASRCVLMFLMFFGRLGGLTMLTAFTAQRTAVPSKLPRESVAVG